MPGDQYILKPCGKHYGFNGDKCSLCAISRPVDGIITTDTYHVDNSHSNKKKALTDEQIYAYFHTEEPMPSSVPAPQEESLQVPVQECDHIVGCTEPQEDTPWVILLKKSQYKPRLYFLDPFNYCPECGEAITN